MNQINWLAGQSPAQLLDIDNKFWKFLSANAYPATRGRLRVPISLEPFIISKQKFADLNQELQLVINAAKKLVEKYFTDPALQKTMAVNPREKDLITVAKDQPLIGIIRIDLFYGQTPQIVEINADFPDGFFMHDITAQAIINNLPDYNLNAPNHAQLFSQLLKDCNIQTDDHIFCGYNQERTFIDEFVLTKQRLTQLGWTNVSAGTFENLEFKNNRFYFNHQPVAVIRRGAELSKLIKNPRLIGNWLQAEQAGNLTVLNNFKLRLLGHKSLMAALHDPNYQHYLSAPAINAVKKLLPLTLKLDRADYPALIANQADWVLKPADLAEGEKVFVGSSLAAADWLQALTQAKLAPDSWIVQRKISIPETAFNLIDPVNRQLISENKKFDFNPHYVLTENQTRAGNILIRFSDSAILNVMKGGGLTYGFVK